jgi:hypothetical protein
MTHPSPTPRGSGFVLVLSLAAIGVVGSVVGCGAAPDDHAPIGGPATIPSTGIPTCGTEEGCPCEHAGDSVDCKVYRKSGDYVACSIGATVCGEDLKWGKCTGGDQVAADPASTDSDSGVTHPDGGAD